MDAEQHGDGEYSISSDYLVTLSEQAFERGMAIGELLQGCGLSSEVLLLQDVSIGHRSFLQAVSNFQKIDNNLWSALEGGRRMTLSKHGYLGYAAQHSRSLSEAADKLYRYVSTRINFVALESGQMHPEMNERSDRAMLCLRPLEPQHPAMRYVCLSLLSCLDTLCRQILGRGAAHLASHITMQGEAPNCPPPALPGGSKISFGASVYSLSWPNSILDLPLATRDADLAKLAEARCENDLRRSLSSQRLSSRVLAQLQRSQGELPTIDDVAARLNMSTATLQRRLKTEQCSYQQLKDEFRQKRARELLKQAVSIELIAEQLGYSDASNFAKAFKTWTGLPPSVYRQQLRKKSET